MKSKVLKIGTVLLTCVCLISFIVLPVSALSANEGFVIKNTKLAWASSIVSSPNIISSSSDVIDGETNAAFVGFSGNDAAVNFYRPLVVQGVSGSTASSYTVNVKYYGVYFSTSNGYSSYSGNASAFVNGVKPSNFKNFKGVMLDTTAYGGEFTFQVNSNTNFTLVLYCGYNSTMASQHYFYCDITAYKNDGTQDIIDNQNSNTQAEIEADKENTDKILNDWDGGVDVDDGTTDNFKNAEDAALGGKTDSQIQEEINNAIDFDINIFDSAKIGKMHSLFDNVLSACGSSYQALFMLCLTLGLAAFLIGRRYG